MNYTKSIYNGYNYEVRTNILNAANYGVPQTRRRLVIHGVRRDVYKKLVKKDNKFGFPLSTHVNPVSNKQSNVPP